jgi:hypothetical protein
MTEEDFKALRKWLVEHGYYVGNHEVADALRKLADAWDDQFIKLYTSYPILTLK